VIGIEEGEADPRQLADIAARLPEGSYQAAEGSPSEAALGWLLAQHRFDRYRETPEPSRLPIPSGSDSGGGRDSPPVIPNAISSG
jgi:hypothetical protein